MSTQKHVTSIAQGQAAVYRVISELMFRGFRVSVPCADDHGVDLTVEHLIRVQVKSAHLGYRPTCYQQGAYWFKLGHGVSAMGKNRTRSRGTRQFSAECEFVVLFGIEEQRFWIVPAPKLDNHHLVVVGPDVGYRQIDLDDVKRLQANGRTITEVAQELGVGRETIVRRKRGEYVESRHTISSQARECEGRWDLIEELLGTLQEANRLVAPAPKQEVVIDREAFLRP